MNYDDCEICRSYLDGYVHKCTICGKECCFGCIDEKTLDTSKEVCDQCAELKPTHYIRCKHCVNSNNCKYYTMDCLPIKETRSGRMKVIIFGERYWNDRDHIKKIRYVDKRDLFIKA